MNVLFDINHPAHVHVFKNAINRLLAEGHNLLVTSRDKEFATQLLDHSGLNHKVLTTAGSNKNGSFLKELLVRDWRLFKTARDFDADVMVSVAGTFISHVSMLTGIPSLVLYDTEDAKLQNLITYPFLTRLCVPECYNGWTPSKKTIRYRGYHELAYLAPEYFELDHLIAEKNGIKAGQNIFIRLVSWQASHDIGYDGWSEGSLDSLLSYLTAFSNVIISSERKLPEKYNEFLYDGDIGQIHHVLGACDLYLGESATMASEAAVLGVSTIYISDAYRSYMNDIQDRYGLVRVIEKFDFNLIQQMVKDLISVDKNISKQQRAALLAGCVDVTALIVSQVLELSGSDSK